MGKRNIRSSTTLKNNKEGANYNVNVLRTRKSGTASNVRKNTEFAVIDADSDADYELKQPIDEAIEWEPEPRKPETNINDYLDQEKDSSSQEEFNESQYLKGALGGDINAITDITTAHHSTTTKTVKKPLKDMPLYVYKSEILKKKVKLQKESATP